MIAQKGLIMFEPIWIRSVVHIDSTWLRYKHETFQVMITSTAVKRIALSGLTISFTYHRHSE